MKRNALKAVLVCLLLVAGCDDAAQAPGDLGSEIHGLLEAGHLGQAEQLSKTAIRADPDDPDLRVLYGRIHLAAGNGAAARIAFDKAIALGADAEGLQTRLARALLLEEEYFDVLRFADSAVRLEPPARTEMAVIRLTARLNLGGGDAGALRRSAQDIVSTLDSTAETEPWAVSLRKEMDALREAHPMVAAAFRHARCLPSPVENYFTAFATGSTETATDVIRVGPNRPVKTPAEAAEIAVDGSTIELDAADYPGGVALWRQNNLTIRGTGGRPHIQASGKAVKGRDIWLFTGNDIVVENIEFSGARSKQYRNGAGIRHIGDNLIVRHGYFHDSDNGILTWKSPEGEIVIEFSEFARNGFGDGKSHNVYIGDTGRLTFRYNYSHAANEGHLLKSRARINDIRYNRLTGEEGRTSYVIDLPNGGEAYVIGNVIEKAVASRNPYVVSFGAEGLNPKTDRLHVVNNSIYNRASKAIVVQNASDVPALIFNNLIGGATVGLASGPIEAAGNRAYPDHGMVNPRDFDFALLETAGAIDAAVDLKAGSSTLPLLPEAEYVHPVSMRARVQVARLDVGAQEFCSRPLGAIHEKSFVD
jgi:hypothetical protein